MSQVNDIYRNIPGIGDLDIQLQRRGAFGHGYKVPGQGTLVSVTTVLNTKSKYQLEKWKREQVAERFADFVDDVPSWDAYDRLEATEHALTEDRKAMDMGSASHRWIEAEHKAIAPDFSDLDLTEQEILEAKWSADIGRGILNKAGIEILEAERMVWHPKLKFGGTIDVVGRRRGYMCVVDWKRNTGLYADQKVQPVVYAAALLSNIQFIGPTLGTKCAVVRLPTHQGDYGEMKWVEGHEMAGLMRYFEALLNAYNEARELKLNSRW